MKTSVKFALTTSALVLSALTPSLSAATITNGDVTFTLGDSSIPLTPTATDPGQSNLTVNGPAGPDHLSSTWWWYSTPSDSRELAFNSPNSTQQTGDTLTLNFADAERGFTGILRYSVLDSGVDEGVLLQSMTIRNTTNQNLTLSLYLYRDIDLNGSSGGDTVTPNGSELEILDGTWADYSEVTSDYVFDDNVSTRNMLVDANLDPVNGANDGPNALANYAHITRFTVTLLPGRTATFTSSDTITNIPAPASMALLGLGGLVVGRRRRA